MNFARTETCSTCKTLQNLPKKLASNDAEDLLCSLFLYFLSFSLRCVCVRVHFKKKQHFFFKLFLHIVCLCGNFEWLCSGCHCIFKSLVIQLVVCSC